MQQVVIIGEPSNWMDVTGGVPQGSVLGPILFVIYMNCLPEIANSRSHLFVDDTIILRTTINPED